MSVQRALGGSVAGQRGSAALEVVILTPALLALIGLIIAGGRIEVAAGAVEQAAYAAARQASIARDANTARSLATDTATAMLRQRGLNCSGFAVRLDLSGFSAPLGEPSVVRAEISCTVALGDVTAPGIPGAKQLTYTATSPIDPWREKR